MKRSKIKFRHKPRVRLRAKLRKKRLRSVGITIGVFVAIVGVLAATLLVKNTVLNFLRSEIFIIKKINLRGVNHIDKEGLHARIKSLLLDRNIPIWSADYKKISFLLKEKYPRIKKISFIPTSTNELMVKITERKAIALIASEDVVGENGVFSKVSAIDEEGAIFSPDERNESQSLPLIKSASNKEHIKDILFFIKFLDATDGEFSKKIKSISIENFMLRLNMDENYDVLWGEIDEFAEGKIAPQTLRKIFKEKISAVKTVRRDALERYGHCAYIDLGPLTGSKEKRVVCCIAPS